MKFSCTVATTLIFTQMLGGLALSSLPSVAKTPLAQATPLSHDAVSRPNHKLTHQFISPLKENPSATPTLEKPSSTPDSLGEELMQQVFECIQKNLSSSQQPSMAALEAASMQCVFKVVMLAPDGSIRPDASDRLSALVRTTGVTLPKPFGQGQAVVQLEQLPDSQIFTIPVTINGQSQAFLFDTGASNSIVESQVAKKLGLAGTPIPPDLLQYMVVGNDCSKVEATLHSLPPLSVEAAKVERLNGLGLPRTAIISNLSGVLGLDFLSSFDVVLNPKTLQVQLLPPSNSSPDAIPLKGKLGVMTTQAYINGQGPFTFLLDTGASWMVVSEDLAKRLSLDVTQAKETEVRGFCGAQTGKQTKLAQVSLQQHQSTNLDAVVLSSGVLDVLGVDGIVGQNFLNQYRQHWRFGERNELSFPEEGSLVLSPL